MTLEYKVLNIPGAIEVLERRLNECSEKGWIVNTILKINNSNAVKVVLHRTIGDEPLTLAQRQRAILAKQNGIDADEFSMEQLGIEVDVEGNA